MGLGLHNHYLSKQVSINLHGFNSANFVPNQYLAQSLEFKQYSRPNPSQLFPSFN